VVDSLPGRVTTPLTATPRWSAAPPPSRCVASKASGRGPLLPFLDHVSHINWQTCVAHLLPDHEMTGGAGV